MVDVEALERELLKTTQIVDQLGNSSQHRVALLVSKDEMKALSDRWNWLYGQHTLTRIRGYLLLEREND